MADYTKSCSELLAAVGGLDNIISVSHCATRLRIVLKDKKQYDTKEIDKIDGVHGLFYNSGQLQVIFGIIVPDVYKTFIQVSGINEEAMKTLPARKQNIFVATLKSFPAVIMPLLGVLTSCGIIAGILAIIQIILTNGFNIEISSSPWYLLFSNIGSLVTGFLCLFICISAARYWKVNLFIATAIGLFLVAGPTLGTLIPYWSTYEPNSAGSLPYVSSVFTGMIAIKFCSWIEHWLDKKVNENWKLFIVASVSITLTILFTLLLFGPIMLYLQELLSIISNAITSPYLYGFGIAILACVFAPIVITGVHQALVPIILTNLANDGYDMLISLMLASNIAQGAAAMACAIKTKDKKVRSLGYSTGVVALIGFTEAAMFGVNLRNKRAFFSAMIGAFVGGWFIGYMQAGLTSLTATAGLPAILYGLPTDTSPDWITYMNAVWLAVGMAIAFVVTMVIALLWLSKKPNHKETWLTKKALQFKLATFHVIEKFNDSKFVATYNKIKREIFFFFNKKEKLKYYYDSLPKKNHVVNPAIGTFLPLNEVKDPVFASGSMGIGFVITPSKGMIYAPFTGQVSMLFNTKHAIGLKSNDGIELLIHIGIDTVKLDGKYFKSYVVQNDLVNESQKLIKFNLNKIKKHKYDPSVVVIITNQDKSKTYQLRFNQKTNTIIDNKKELISVKS